ncbi:MAG TPA: class I SAM-dependent methyltransferase [Ilumatobacteraceae bacterium]
MKLPVPDSVRSALRDKPLARRVAARFGLLAHEPFAPEKRERLERIAPLLRTDMAYNVTANYFDFLSPALQREFHITSTDNVSANDYDEYATGLIAEHAQGVVLDCGAGLRAEIHDNVVNFEICSYPSTDVRGVGERLPFKDNVFDAVLSLSVLEHVRDPFACAREISRVLKPGGKLYCNVPLLQPLHGYPSHYFNMTHQGLRRLFEDALRIDRQFVSTAGQPSYAMCWIVQRWLAELPESEREHFAQMRLADFVVPAITLKDEPFVTSLSADAQFELACSTALLASKPAARAR